MESAADGVTRARHIPCSRAAGPGPSASLLRGCGGWTTSGVTGLLLGSAKDRRAGGEHLAYSFLSLSFAYNGYQDSCYLGELTSSSIQTRETTGGAQETDLGQTYELSERTPSPHTAGVNSDAGRRCVSNKASTQAFHAPVSCPAAACFHNDLQSLPLKTR